MVWVHEAAGSNPVTPINATITLIGKGSVLKTLSNRDERCSCSSRDSGGNMAPYPNFGRGIRLKPGSVWIRIPVELLQNRDERKA